jgi:ferrous iron transport protein B
MQQFFDGQIGAFAYLLFILLYSPCVAAIAALYRETGLRWTMFAVSWTSFLAYATATLFYQSMTFSNHPSGAMSWIIGLSLLFVGILSVLRFYGLKQIQGGSR